MDFAVLYQIAKILNHKHFIYYVILSNNRIMKARFLNSQGTLFVIFVNNNSYCLNSRNLHWWSNIIIQNYYFEGNCHLLQSEFKESSFNDSISTCNHEKRYINFIMINNWHYCSKINPLTPNLHNTSCLFGLKTTQKLELVSIPISRWLSI